MTAPELPAQPQRYTFVLSLWRERTSAPWRMALRAADREMRLGFASIEQLAAFLRQVTTEQARSQEQESRDCGGEQRATEPTRQ
jgi:hypothetical protein